MATTNIIPFADATSNVLPDSSYATFAPTGMPLGYQPPSQTYNKSLLQSSIMVSALANFMINYQASNVDDSDTPSDIASFFTQALYGLLNVTPPQFDVSTNLATTQFVQTALGNNQTASTNTSNLLIVLPDSAGSVFTLAPMSGTGIVNLPAISDLLPGAQFTFLVDLGHSSVIQANGSDLIFNQGLGSSSLSLPGGSTVILVADNRGWEVVNPSSLTNWVPSLSTNGYLIFPIGAQKFVLQWGQQTLSTPNLSYFTSTVLFPITFPNMCFLGLALPQTKVNPDTNTAVISTFSYTRSSMGIGLDSNVGGILFSTTQRVSFISVGF